MQTIRKSFIQGNTWETLSRSVRFFLQELVPITALGLFAALGRAIQMGAIGAITDQPKLWLEVVVALARIAILLYIVGEGQFAAGIGKFRNVLHLKKSQRKALRNAIFCNLRSAWPVLLVNCLAFGILAFVTNLLISNVAENTAVSTFLKDQGVLSQTASKYPVIFFLKNLTIIPFTLVFEYFLLKKLLSGFALQRDKVVQ